MQSKRLFEMFPPVAPSTWKEQIRQDLKGKDPATLVWDTGEGFSLAPFYTVEDLPDTGDALPGEAPFRRGNRFHASEPGWQIVAELSEKTADKAWLHDGAAAVRGPVALCHHIDLHQKALHLCQEGSPALLAAEVYRIMAEKREKADFLTGTLLNDPISVAAGEARLPAQSELDAAAEGIRAFRPSPWFRGLGLGFGWVQEAGGTIVQQVAFALAATVEYHQQLTHTEGDISEEELFQNLAFTFPAGTLFFPELAKFRAFRMLFSRMLGAMGIENPDLQSPFLIARPSRWDQSHYDVHTNLLRHTTAAIAAVAGGVQALSLPAFDPEQPENEDGIRLARNIQLLLKHESYLDKVLDPAGGAYYIEQATEQVAAAAWTLFQEIEAKGGLLVCVASGQVQAWLETELARRRRRIATRKQTLVGINNYPDADEVLEFVPDMGSYFYAAADFERIRSRADAWGRQRDKRLTASLLTFGDLAMRNARAQFARNLLAAGGFYIHENPYPEEMTPTLAELQALSPDVIVLCSADADYFQSGPGLIAQIRESLPETRLILAGKPDNAASLGADDLIFAGIDAVDFLEKLMHSLY